MTSNTQGGRFKLSGHRLQPDLKRAIDRVMAGDVSAFRLLVDATMTRLYRLAVRLMGDMEEAEDVLQDGYFRAFEALSRRRFDARSSVETWLYRIVVNAALDALRSQRRRQRGVIRRLGPAATSTDPKALEARLALRELADWVGELTPDQRAALLLKELEGLTAGQVAQVMGCSEGAVEQHLVRARAALRARRDSG